MRRAYGCCRSPMYGSAIRAVVPMRGRACARAMPHDVEVPTPEIAVFGDQVASVLARILGDDLVGVYFVGSVALGGYVPGESDVDIAAVSGSALSEGQKRSVAAAI